MASLKERMNRALKSMRERGIYDAFLVTVVLKGIDGVLEFVLGLLLIFTDTVSDIIFFLTNNQIIEDPNDFFATHLRAFASQSHQAFVFGGLYLIAHGVIKAFLSVSLWRNYVWAYPAAMLFLALFIIYQIIEIVARGSIALVFLTVFDLTMFWLVYHEYRRLPHRS